MTYLQTHSSRNGEKRRRTVVVVLVVVVVITALLELSAPHFFASIFTAFARPFWRTEFGVNSGALLSADELLRQNEDLRRQISSDAVRLDTIGSIETENSDLKALMGRSSTTPYVLAAVLVVPPSASYDELVIDIGANHNVSVGSKVYAVGNVLIGEVSDVLGQTAKVKLYSSAGEKYDVRIGPSHVSATAIGRGGGQYQAELSRDIVVSSGDFVNSPGLNDRPFGVVSTVLMDPAQPFETVLFSPPVNIYQIRWVLVDTDMPAVVPAKPAVSTGVSSSSQNKKH